MAARKTSSALAEPVNPIRQRSKGDHVRHRLLDGRALIALLLPIFCGSPSAAAEIFKCAAKDATPLYQNFPCQFDSIGGMPSNAQLAKTSFLSPDARGAAQKAVPGNVASTATSADTREVRVGMRPDEVRAILGEPLEAVQDGSADADHETWRYVDRTIEFDRTHRVVVVQAW
jgi:hypothetical protein